MERGLGPLRIRGSVTPRLPATGMNLKRVVFTKHMDRLTSCVCPCTLPEQMEDAVAGMKSFQFPELLGKDGGDGGSRRAKQTRSLGFSEVTSRDSPDSGAGGGERAPQRPAAIRPRPGSVPSTERRARPRRPRAAARGRLRARPRPPPSPTTPGDGGHAGARLTCAGSSGRRW